MIQRVFVWPVMYCEVVDWRRSCARCQKVNKTKAPKAPLQTVPVITEPFEKIAFDIVGPFPRTKDGYKYTLSRICLASKYPEAILLKDVRAETVSEGMAEVFSRISVPRQLLTDQGSQFAGRSSSYVGK